MGFKRDLFTGKLVRTKNEGGGRQIIYREEIPSHLKQTRTCNQAYNRPLVSKAMGVIPEQAAEFNEAAKRNNTGAFYDPRTGDAVFETRRARAREMQARGMRDNDAGYGDFAGNNS